MQIKMQRMPEADYKKAEEAQLNWFRNNPYGKTFFFSGFKKGVAIYTSSENHPEWSVDKSLRDGKIYHFFYANIIKWKRRKKKGCWLTVRQQPL